MSKNSPLQANSNSISEFKYQFSTPDYPSQKFLIVLSNISKGQFKQNLILMQIALQQLLAEGEVLFIVISLINKGFEPDKKFHDTESNRLDSIAWRVVH